MPKAAAMADFSGPSLDCVGHRDMYAARLPGIALSTRSTGARQMAPKPLATAFAIDILIDGLVANRETSQAMATNVSSYLFGRPGGRQTVRDVSRQLGIASDFRATHPATHRSEEHTSELQSLMRNSSAVFCLNKK